jgi:hypothetical protein
MMLIFLTFCSLLGQGLESAGPTAHPPEVYTDGDGLYRASRMPRRSELKRKAARGARNEGVLVQKVSSREGGGGVSRGVEACQGSGAERNILCDDDVVCSSCVLQGTIEHWTWTGRFELTL